jgi:hypothetical protein
MLDLFFSSNTSAVPLSALPASAAAWSLCCQQKKRDPPGWLLSMAGKATTTPLLPFGEAVGEVCGEAGCERRHERPLDVIPLQVVVGFLESERAMSDSGV